MDDARSAKKIGSIALIEPAVRAECLTTEIFAQIRASLPFLAGALAARGIRTGVYCEELVDVAAGIGEIVRNYDAAGISVTINTVRRAIALAGLIKKARPEMPVVFGGHVAGFFSGALLEAGDACIVGRAENSLAEYLERPVRGRVFTAADSGPSDFSSDYSTTAGFGGYSEKKNILGIRKPPIYSLFTSTGCVRGCRFCVTERKFVARRIADVEADLHQILSRHRGFLPPHIMIVDDCPFGDQAHLEEVIGVLKNARRKRSFSAMMQFHVRPLTTVAGLAGRLRGAGVATLLIGFESASDATLAGERKGTTVAENEEAISVCRGAGIVPYGYFVAGFDTDDEEGVRGIFDFIMKKRLVAQVLPLGVMENPGGPCARTLDPYSFGATIFVSHRPALMGPAKLQRILIDGFERIFAAGRAFFMPTAREAAYQFFYSAAYAGWRKKLSSHLKYLENLEKFSDAGAR